MAHAEGCNGEGGNRNLMIIGVGLDVLTKGVGVGAVAGGPTLNAGVLRRLACDAAVIPAVLGADSERQLFPGKPSVGQTIAISGYPYTVIGVLEKKQQNGSYGSGPDNTQMFVPYSAMVRDFPPDFKGSFPGYVNNIVVQPVNPQLHEAAMRQVREVLGARHHFDPIDLDALWVWDTLDSVKFTDRIFHVMTLFFAAVALLTLALGGIGVMNIMLVAVSERTREIGIRKALGAKRKDVMVQFLIESAAMALLGGLFGVIGGVTVAEIVTHLVGFPSAIALGHTVICFPFCHWKTRPVTAPGPDLMPCVNSSFLS